MVAEKSSEMAPGANLRKDISLENEKNRFKRQRMPPDGDASFLLHGKMVQ